MDERRRYERVAWFAPVQLTILPNGPVIAARSFDLSRGGVGVVADGLQERGQTLYVRFFFQNGSGNPMHEDVLGRVAYSLADEDGERLGIEFIEPIQETTNPLLTQKLESL